MTERIESARSDRPGRGLSERLALTFAILLTTVACLYGVVIVFSVGFTEEELISSFLRDELEQARDDLEGGRIPREAPNTLIFGEGDAERLAPIPPAFRHVREGFTELTESPSAFVWRGAWRGGSLIIVRDQAGFEEKEQALFLVMAGSIILVFLLGAFLGGRLSRRVMRPVEKLSVAVRERTAAGEWKPLPPELLTRDEVGELAQNCSDSMRRLMEDLKREKAFTGDASHELRTPLTVIETSAELLELGSLDPRQREQVARISRAAESMRETIETLLEFARAASRSDLKAPPDSVEGIVAVAASRWREFAEDKGLALEVVREAPCPGAYARHRPRQPSEKRRRLRARGIHPHHRARNRGVGGEHRPRYCRGRALADLRALRARLVRRGLRGEGPPSGGRRRKGARTLHRRADLPAPRMDRSCGRAFA